MKFSSKLKNERNITDFELLRHSGHYCCYCVGFHFDLELDCCTAALFIYNVTLFCILYLLTGIIYLFHSLIVYLLIRLCAYLFYSSILNWENFPKVRKLKKQGRVHKHVHKATIRMSRHSIHKSSNNVEIEMAEVDFER